MLYLIESLIIVALDWVCVLLASESRFFLKECCVLPKASGAWFVSYRRGIVILLFSIKYNFCVRSRSMYLSPCCDIAPVLINTTEDGTKIEVIDDTSSI